MPHCSYYAVAQTSMLLTDGTESLFATAYLLAFIALQSNRVIITQHIFGIVVLSRPL